MEIKGLQMNDSNSPEEASSKSPLDGLLVRQNSVKFSVKDFLSHQKLGDDEDLDHPGGHDSANKSLFESKYSLGALLGEGGFGEVFVCVLKSTKEERAVKRMEKDPRRDDVNEEVIREFEVLTELDHPNLLKAYDLFEETTDFFIVTDIYGGGDMIDYLEAVGHLPEADVKIVMNKLLSSMKYLHNHCQMVHRDLKLENILLDTSQDLEQMKLIDFGLAMHFDDPSFEFDDLVGSTAYVAPQVIEGFYTVKCDMWSCGVIAYCLLAGYTPFDGMTDGEILQEVLIGKFDFTGDVWDGVSNDAKDFICNLLAYDEVDRPTAELALSHPWLENYRQEVLMEGSQVDRAASIRESLVAMRKFTSKKNKLKQAVCAMIASQLLQKDNKNEIEEHFLQLDRSMTGTITKDDLRQVFEKHTALKPDDKLIDSIFSHVNYSGSGQITYSEYAIAMMFERGMVGDDQLKIVFGMLDKDGDGIISIPDLQKSLGLDHVQCVKMMFALDEGYRNGNFTLEQFKDIVLPKYDFEMIKEFLRKIDGSSLDASNSDFSSSRRNALGKQDDALGSLLHDSATEHSDEENEIEGDAKKKETGTELVEPETDGSVSGGMVSEKDEPSAVNTETAEAPLGTSALSKTSSLPASEAKEVMSNVIQEENAPAKEVELDETTTKAVQNQTPAPPTLLQTNGARLEEDKNKSGDEKENGDMVGPLASLVANSKSDKKQKRRQAVKCSTILNGGQDGSIATETSLDEKDAATGKKKTVVLSRPVKKRVDRPLFSNKTKPEFDWAAVKDTTFRIATAEERKEFKPDFNWQCLTKSAGKSTKLVTQPSPPSVVKSTRRVSSHRSDNSPKSPKPTARPARKKTSSSSHSKSTKSSNIRHLMSDKMKASKASSRKKSESSPPSGDNVSESRQPNSDLEKTGVSAAGAKLTSEQSSKESAESKTTSESAPELALPPQRRNTAPPKPAKGPYFPLDKRRSVPGKMYFPSDKRRSVNDASDKKLSRKSTSSGRGRAAPPERGIGRKRSSSLSELRRKKPDATEKSTGGEVFTKETTTRGRKKALPPRQRTRSLSEKRTRDKERTNSDEEAEKELNGDAPGAKSEESAEEKPKETASGRDRKTPPERGVGRKRSSSLSELRTDRSSANSTTNKKKSKEDKAPPRDVSESTSSSSSRKSIPERGVTRKRSSSLSEIRTKDTKGKTTKKNDTKGNKEDKPSFQERNMEDTEPSNGISDNEKETDNKHPLEEKEAGAPRGRARRAVPPRQRSSSLSELQTRRSDNGGTKEGKRKTKKKEEGEKGENKEDNSAKVETAGKQPHGTRGTAGAKVEAEEANEPNASRGREKRSLPKRTRSSSLNEMRTRPTDSSDAKPECDESEAKEARRKAPAGRGMERQRSSSLSELRRDSQDREGRGPMRKSIASMLHRGGKAQSSRPKSGTGLFGKQKRTLPEDVV